MKFSCFPPDIIVSSARAKDFDSRKILPGDKPVTRKPLDETKNPYQHPSVMKTLLPFSFALALAATGTSHAQQAFSKPSGYMSQNLVPNQFNLIGLSLHSSPFANGSFEAVSGTQVTDNDAAFSPVAGRVYVLEITSGAIAGTIQEIPAASIQSKIITAPDNLQTMGLVAGDKYSIRLAPTLEEIFGTGTNSALTRALNSNAADVVWIPSATGYNKYYLHSTTSAFRDASAPGVVLTPNVSVVYADGILVQKKGSPTTLTVTVR